MTSIRTYAWRPHMTTEGTVLICDHPECDANFQGNRINIGDPISSAVRPLAQFQGWQVSQNASPYGTDLCPQHRTRTRITNKEPTVAVTRRASEPREFIIETSGRGKDPMNVTEFLIARLAEDELQPAHLRPHWAWCGYAQRPGERPCFCGRNALEVRAKRAIVEKSKQPAIGAGEFGDGYHWAYGDVITALATAYADHSDFPRECTG